MAHQLIDLGDHLHVGVFNAVVQGLDEMPGTITTKVSAARLAVGNGGDSAQDTAYGGEALR